jgi:hypothetical protein
MPNPLVSILIPCGPRHVEHVRTAVASVAWQTLAPYCETIVACDGGAEVAPMAGATILPSDGERRGPAWARNRALEVARGAFVLPLDADDYLLPNAVAHLLREYGRGTHGYVYGDSYTLERDGSFMHRSAPDYHQETLRNHNPHVVTALTPTHHWRAVGGWDEGVDAWEDWAGHLRLAIAGVCGYRLGVPILTYRVYEGDRMTRFYGGDPEFMRLVRVRYQNTQGEIPMASCCGGDPGLAALAANVAQGAPFADPAPMAGGLVRVEYIGDDRGTQYWKDPFDPTWVTGVPLGNNAMNRYADVTPKQAEWLREHGVPIRVVPLFDRPDPPTPAPILQRADVLTPDNPAQALRPRGRKVA